MSTNPSTTRLYARDSGYSARLTALAYEAGRFRPGMRPDEIAAAVRSIPYHQRIFATDADIEAFSQRYDVVAARAGGSQGTGVAGSDVLVLRDRNRPQIAFLVAGIGNAKEGYETWAGTETRGYNDRSFVGVQEIYRDVIGRFPTHFYDLHGHSLGGQMIQILAGRFWVDGRMDQLNSMVTFGTYGIDFGVLANPNLPAENRQLLEGLRVLERNKGFTHFRNKLDPIPSLGSPLTLSRRVAGFYFMPGMYSIEQNPHSILTYIVALDHPSNNQEPLPVLFRSEREGEIGAVSSLLGLDPAAVDRAAVGYLNFDGSATYRLANFQLPWLDQVDPLTGARLPRGLRRVPSRIIDGFTYVEDRQGRVVDLEVVQTANGPVVVKSRAQDGFGKSGAGVTVETTYSGGRPVSTNIKINNNPIGIEFSDAGGVIGQQLGTLLAGDNRIAGVVASAALQTIGDALGDVLDGLVGNMSATKASKDAVATFGAEFLANLKAAGVGAVSSFLSAELVKALGVEGFAAELANTVAGSAITTIINNILAGAANPFQNVTSAANLGTAVASFLGNKLASEIVSFDTVGGQLGAAIGSSLGVIGVSSAIVGTGIHAALLGVKLGMWAGPVAALVGAFIGTLVGGLIGSVFGGTPRSGADVLWDEAKGEFVVANVYSRKGGSKDAAREVASAVAQTFNSVIDATGGTLMEPEAVQSGNYGMRKKDFVYRPVSTRDKDAITQRFSGSKGAERLIGYGTYEGLSDPDFKIVGGNPYVKRAVYNTLADPAVTGFNFDASLLLGNIGIAERYETYLANSASINALIAAEPDSVFTSEWAITFAKAVELGLTRRHESDWYGGYTALLSEAGVTAASVQFDYNYDALANRPSRVLLLGELMLPDSIDVDAQMHVAGTDGNDVIKLSGTRLAATDGVINSNLKVNGQTHNGAATDIDVAAVVEAGSGNDVIHTSDRGDNVFGGVGNDIIYGGRLDDWLFGGDGDDRLDAGSQAGGLGGDGNYLAAGAGNDTVYGREGSDWLEGHEGTDQLDGGGGDDILGGGTGALDQLKGGHGDDQYLVRLGDDLDEADEVASGAPVSPLTGGTGDAIRDRFTMLSNPLYAHLRNWLGDDREIELAETVRTTVGATAPGAVAAVAAGGEDAIVFGQGIEMGDVRLFRPKDAYGNDLPDLVVQVMTTDPATGVESFSGTQLRLRDWFTNPFKRVEWLKFADGNEIRIADVETFIVGTNGDDILNGTNGRDFVYGGGGNDHIRLYAGDDIGSGGTGDDAVWGDEDRDLLIGGLGKDMLYGGTQDDSVSGDAGDDELMGEDGNDVLSGGRGSDMLVGGAGIDTIKFARGDGRDTIVVEPTTAILAPDDMSQWQTVWTYGDDPLLHEDLSFIDHYRWFGTGATRQLRIYTGQSQTVYAAGDVIEFDIGIDIQDVMLVRSGADLVLVVADENAEGISATTAADSITIQDWFQSADLANWSSTKPVGRFAFYQTGILDAATGVGWSLIAGGDGADTIAAGSLTGASGKFWITGGAGGDVIDGAAQGDILHGNAGFDELRGGAGEDVLYGGAGDDVLTGGADKDVLAGGSGLDTASYAGSSGVNASLEDSSRNTGDAAGDVYSGIENLTGGDGADKLSGDADDNIIEGGKGADRLRAWTGDDTYVWNAGDGSDTIEEGAFAFDEIMSADGTLAAGYQATASVEPANYPYKHYELTIEGPGGTVYSKYFISSSNYSTQHPELWPADGWDQGYARTGNGSQVARETLLATDAGNDTLEMGAGISLADLSFERIGDNLVIRHGGSAITITGQFGAGGQQRVEWLQFADGQAVSLARVIAAAAGTPSISGDPSQAVDELLAGDAAANSISGLGGNDALSGAAGTDTLSGGEGNDILEGGSGADTIDGGAHGLAVADPNAPAGGTPADATGWGDTARYATSAASVRIALAGSTLSYGTGGDAQGDAISNVEHVLGSNATGATAWGNAGDHLTGDGGDNRLFGLAGDDYLAGGDGMDVLIGGEGADLIEGGAGDDNLDGGDGDDRLYGGSGNDFLAGGAGSDRLEAGTPVSTLPGAGSALSGGADDDQLYGASGADDLTGDGGNDDLFGGSGSDMLAGGAGADELYGGDGDDVIIGGDGNELLLSGQGGNDTYVFGADSGIEEISDTSGANRILFDQVAPEQLWLTRAGDNLTIRVIGGTTQVTVLGYFAASNPTLLREIATDSKSIFLKYAAGPNYETSLVKAMSAVPMPTSVADVPTTVAAMRDSLWILGDKATPVVSDQVHQLTERAEPGASVSLTGQVGAVDYDDNIGGAGSYSIAAGPQLGTVTLSTTTAGAWTYIPTLYANGTDTFRLRVVDADGHAAEQTVTVNIAAVNSRPVFAASQPALSILETAAGGTQIATIAVSDPDGTTPTLSIAEANSPFQISAAGVLSVKAGATFSSQATPTINVTVQASDGVTPLVSRQLSVTIVNVNDAPGTPVVSGTALAIAPEGALGGTKIADFTLADPDGDATSLRIRTGSTSIFATSGARLSFAAGFSPNFETVAAGAVLVDRDLDGQKEIEYSVAVESWDGQVASTGAKTMVVGIEDVNEAPTSITLTGAATATERDRPPTGATLPALSLGTLSAADPDIYFGETFVFTTTDGRFEVVNGNELRLKANVALDFESAAVDGNGQRYVDVPITARDHGGTGLSLTRNVRVFITDAVDYIYGTAAAETLSGVASRDAIYGREGDDTIHGLQGDDDLYGEAGADTLYGGDGNDLVDGGLGADRLEGGLGDDVYIVDDAADAVVEQPGQGNDEVRTALADYTLAANVEKLTGTVGTGQKLRGNDLANIVTAGAGTGANQFWLQGGGADVATGASGGDLFLMGASFGAGDILNGGGGTDQVALQGNYNLTVAAAQWTSIESLAIMAGNNIAWGDAGGNFYSYNLTLHNANIAAGVQLVVDANTLRVGENLTFSLAGELDGSALIYGGLGTDILTGGAGNDTFYFSSGKFGASDVLVGGAGTDSLYLRYGLTATFGAGQLTGIETIGFTAGTAGVTPGYNITVNNANLAAGGAMTVAGGALLASESLTFNASAETDGTYNITGGAGADVLTGGALADTIAGGAGNDTLSGGAGADTLTGGTGDDVYIVDSTSDSVAEQAAQGTDEVRTALADYTLAANVENLTGTGTAGQTLRGNVLDNLITGTAGNDIFWLQAGGRDKAVGGTGNDIAFFGGGHSAGDEFDGGDGSDTAAFQGNTTIAAADMRLFNVESISMLAGSNTAWGDSGTGRYSYSFTTTDATAAAGVQVKVNGSQLLAGENLTFNGAAETDGSFYIFGGFGIDVLTGGAGNDLFHFDKDGRFAIGDRVVGGAGTDELFLLGNYTLSFAADSLTGIEKMTIASGEAKYGTDFTYDLTTNNANVAAGQTLTVTASALMAGERLTFSGAAETDGSFNITGGADADTLTGGALADTILGGAGNDTLSGGAGADRLEGGVGDDVYVVDDAGDVVVEESAQGTDEVRTALADYTLAANVEKLTGTLAGTQSLRGNALDNVVTGNVARDWFYMQSGGNDHVIGNGGSDLFFFGSSLDSGDRIDGGADVDAVYIQGNLTLNTSTLNLINVEQLTALSGTDARYGDAGTSLYNYSITTADSTFSGGGRVVIHGGNLVAGENFTFNGAAETDVWYYAIAGMGVDTMTGGAGDDVFYFDKDGRYAAGDTVVGGAGTDEIVMRGAYSVTFGASTFTGIEKLTISSGSAWGTLFNYNITTHESNVAAGQTLTVNASTLLAGEQLTFMGSGETNGNFNITGGAGADTLVGGSLADTIAGGSGDDTLRGHMGNDRLEGGDGNDLLVGGIGADQLVGGNGTDRVSYFNSAAITATLTESVGAISEGGYTKAATSIAYNGVRVDLVANSSTDAVNFTGAVGAIGGEAEGDRFHGIEHVTGSGFNDRLRGTATATEVRGGGGSDVIYGGDGDDALYGEDGDDYVYGQEGRDTIDGGAGNDRLFGEGLGDTLDGGLGNDDLVGGAGQDIYKFAASFGADVIYNYDGDGSPDAMEFDAAAMANTDLWFTKSGKDLVVKQLGTTNQATVKGYFANDVAGDWTDNGDFVVNAIVAGVWASNYKVNTPALLTLMSQMPQPASFAALTVQQQDQIKAAWGVNTKPTITAFASNPVSTGEGYYVDLKFTVADGQSPPASLKLTSTLTSGVFQPIQASDWSFDPTDERVRILRLRPVPDSHGLATLTLTASDMVFNSDVFTTSVRLLARADAVLVSAPTTRSTNVGTTVMLPGTLTDGLVAQVWDTNSEIFNHVKIEGLPVGATLSDGVNSFTAVGATPVTITNWNLAALRVTPAAGSTTDFTMTLKAASKENLQPHEIFPGEQIGPEASTTIKVIVNAAPNAVALRGLGTAATPSVNEFTPTTNPSGNVLGVAVASDPDSIEANKVSTDFNLLPKMGAGEERIVTAAGPTGTQVQVLETGQFAAQGGVAGGGIYGASAGAPDTTKAYKYTIYVKPENLRGHLLYFGTQGAVENATTGAADANPYFYAGGNSNSLVQDRWYRLEGWVLPAGHALVGSDVFGGLFDTVTGAKVANTTAFRFAAGATDTGIRFFSYHGTANEGYSAQWYQPQVEKLDTTYSLIDNGGGRFAINSVTGLVTAVGTNFNYEAATSHNLTVRATDSTGLFKDQVINVGVNNINERPGPLVLQSKTLYSEVVGSDTPHPGQSIARFTMSDPDLTTPTLSIIGGNTYNWFTTTGNQLTFNGANFTAGWLHGTLGAYGQDAGYYYDTDGDGLKEIRVATLTLAATDSGGLQGDPYSFDILIEDKNEAPAFSPAAQTFSLAENPGSYQLVGTLVATDLDDPASNLRYFFTGAAVYYDSALGRNVTASSDGRFVLDNLDGRVWTKGLQALDYEGTRSFSYATQVFDRANGTHKLSAAGTLNINLTNVNETPGPMTLLTQTLHSETLNGDTPHYSAGAIATFSLSDPDGTTPAISIIGGNPYNWFGISGNQLRFSTADFSAAWLRGNAGQYGTDATWNYDTDGDGLKEIRVATLTLAATDSGGLQGSPFTYNVLIEDKNEAPGFSANPYSFSIVENAGWYQYLGQVAGSDIDGVAADLRYVFTGRATYYDGNLGRNVTSSADGRFVMDNLDGRVWKNGNVGIDYETTPSFAYGVTVHDRAQGANSRSAASQVNIGVVNTNDNAPAMPTVDQWGTTAFNENSGSSMAVAYLSVPYDPDGSSGLSYQITSNPDNLFEISGWAIRMKADRTPNYEAFASGGASTTIQVRFRVTDGTYASAENAINVTIYNVNEAPPVMTQVPGTFTVTENTAYNTVVSDGFRATDSEGSPITYSIDQSTNPNGAFGVNALGQIVIANGVDYEAGGWLSDAGGKYANLRVLASDGGLAASGTVQIRIANQVLTVATSTGALTSRYRSEWSSTYVGEDFGGGGGGYDGPGQYSVNQYAWYSEVRYIDNVTGAVVLHDGAYGPYQNQTNRMLPHQSYATLAEGFRWTGNGREIVSDDEHNSWSLGPIVFDLLGSGLDNAFGAPTVGFDVDGNGTPEQLRWLEPGFGLLALDRNGDGRIGSGLEISFTQDKAGATTDLEGLAAFDSNGDDRLSAADLRFGEFLLWQDANADGISQAAELRTLTGAGIASISLDGTPTGRTFANTDGNVILNTAGFTFADGRSGTIGDAVFRPRLADTDVDEADPTPAVTFAAQAFSRKAKKYRLSADGGSLAIVPAKAKGALDPRAGQIGPAALLSFRNKQFGMLAPIVLDLDGDGVELKSIVKSKARFDMNGDGRTDDTGWIGGGDGLLVIDRDGDGRISGPAELSLVREKPDARNALDALAALDSNKDGKIDAADSRFGELKIWVDGDRDGVTDPGELGSLEDHEIASIGLSATANRATARIGDGIVLSTGLFTRSDGSTGTFADAALAFKPGHGHNLSATEGLEDRLEALRSGLAGPLRLASLDLRHDPFPRLARLTEDGARGVLQDLPPIPVGAAVGAVDGPNDPRTALMTQHMAAFGARWGEGEWQLRERQTSPSFDYFA